MKKKKKKKQQYIEWTVKRKREATNTPCSIDFSRSSSKRGGMRDPLPRPLKLEVSMNYIHVPLRCHSLSFSLALRWARYICLVLLTNNLHNFYYFLKTSYLTKLNYFFHILIHEVWAGGWEAQPFFFLLYISYGTVSFYII